MSSTDSNRGTTLLAAIGVLSLLVVAAVLLLTPPASGYEIYIFTAYPWYFWASIVGAIVAGQLVVLTSPGTDDASTALGSAIAMLAVVTLTLLPYLRGYPVYGRGDVLTHVGLIGDLQREGISGNIYPPTHLLAQALAGATGLDPMALVNLLPVAFTVVFLGSMVWLVFAVFDRRRGVRFVLPFVLFPIMGASHVNAVPFSLSLLLVPFALYLLETERRFGAVSVRALLALGVVGVVLYHPLTAMFLIAVLVLYTAAERLLAAGIRSPTPRNVTTLAVVVFGAWYLDIIGILIRFRVVVTDFLEPGGSSQLQGTVATIERTSAALGDILKIAVLQYGVTAVLYGLATLGIAACVARWVSNRRRPDRFVAVFGATTLLFAGLGVVFLTNDLIVGFARPLGFGTIFATVLAGATWAIAWRGTDRTGRRAAITVGVAAVLLVIVPLSVVGMFGSPLVAEKNHQVTQMELDGMDWTFEARNEELLIEEFGIRQYRFHHLRRGVNDSSPTVRRTDTTPPAHFNYTVYETLGRSYETDRYFVLTRLGRITYPAKFPGYREQWQFTPADFDRLGYDSSVASIYDNGEVDVYRIDAAASDVPDSPDGRVRTIE